MVRLMGLYKHKTENSVYVTGKLGSARIVILKNEYKDSDTSPDYIMYIKSNNPENQT